MRERQKRDENGRKNPLALLVEIGKASVGFGICVRFSRMVRSW